MVPESESDKWPWFLPAKKGPEQGSDPSNIGSKTTVNVEKNAA